MKGISILAYTVSELEQKIEELKNSSFQATLGVVFASIEHDFEALQKVFRDRNIDILGASSSGEFANGELIEKGITVLLLDIKRTTYQIYFTETDYDNCYEAGEEIAQYSKRYFQKSAFISVFSVLINAEEMIAGINSKLGKRTPIFGGMASDDFKMEFACVFTAKQLSKKGIGVLILDNDKIDVYGLALSGWQPLGLKNTITKSVNNVIYEINNKPALDEFIKFCGEFQYGVATDDIISLNSAQYPLQILRDDTSILRAFLSANEEDRSLVMSAAVREGDVFRFSIAPGFEILEETLEGFIEYKKKKAAKADALLVFSCKARHLSLGPLIEDEIEGLHEIWEEKPMTGFFSYGEVGQNEEEQSYFYNETCSLAILSEK